MNKPQITVIIPTRERSDVFEQSLQTVFAQNYDNLSIIVSDNFSSDNTKDIVLGLNDPRLKYVNTGKRLSMSHNWEFALSHVRPDNWVTIIGDDDGLLPDALGKVADLIRVTNVKAIRTKLCEYKWPSLTGQSFGRLEVPLDSGLEMRLTKTWLNKVLAGKAKYVQLPMLYTGGFIHMSVLDQLSSKSGQVYKSRIPDIYSGVAISSVLDRYVYSREPVAIGGTSQHSTGMSQFKKTGSLVNSPKRLFASESNIPFHNAIPLLADGDIPKSIQAVIYESFLQSGFLRTDQLEVDHQEQLEIILATSREHKLDIEDWGKMFAEMHELDFKRIRLKSFKKKLTLGAIKLADKIYKELNLYTAGSEKLQIKNVYEASIVAGEVRDHIPGGGKRLQSILRRIIQSS